MRSLRLALPFFLLCGCYDSHGLDVVMPLPDGGTTCDPAARPTCSRRDHACDPLELVDAVCEGVGWVCPGDAREHERPWADDLCLPLADRMGTPFVDGVHEAPVPVPIGATCAWVMPLDRGTIPADLVATRAARSCAELPLPGDPIVDVTGDLDYAAIQAAIVDDRGETRVLARGWRFDAGAPFGVRSLGVGFGRVRAARIEIEDRWLFGEDVDLGDAAIAHDGFAYAYGCPGEPHWLEEDCIVGRAPLDRLDEPSAWSIFGSGGWGVGDPVRVFGSGPHQSSVVRDPRGPGLIHVSAIGFGRDLRLETAPAPEGPWSAPISLGPCDLPPDDPDAYCAGPVVHPELTDPLDPSAIVVAYSVGTTAPDGIERRAAAPRAYWPRLVRVRL